MQRMLRSPFLLIDHFCPPVLRQGGCNSLRLLGPIPLHLALQRSWAWLCRMQPRASESSGAPAASRLQMPVSAFSTVSPPNSKLQLSLLYY